MADARLHTRAGLAALVLPIAIVLAPGPLRALEPGEPAPSVGRPALDGRFVGLVKWFEEPSKPVVVVTFFASWCEACKKEAPHLVELSRRLGPRGLRTVAVGVGMSRDETAEIAKSWYGQGPRATPGPFYVVSDHQQFFAEAFGVVAGSGKAALPRTFVIGRDRKVLARVEQWGEAQAQQLQQVVEAALGTPSL